MQIINRTPHTINIHPTGTASEAPVITLPAAPRGEIARVNTTSEHVREVRVDHIGKDDVRHLGEAPITMTHWGDVVGLPAPKDGVAHVVSVVVAAAAMADGRTLDDLLVPGEQVRDGSGRIVGCCSLGDARYALPGEMLAWDQQRAVRLMRSIAALLCYPDDPAPSDEEQTPGTRRRGSWGIQQHFVVRQPAVWGGGYHSVSQQDGTNAWACTQVDAAEAAKQTAPAG